MACIDFSFALHDCSRLLHRPNITNRQERLFFCDIKSYCCSFPDVFLDLLLLESWKDVSGKVCVKKKEGKGSIERRQKERTVQNGPVYLLD